MASAISLLRSGVSSSDVSHQRFQHWPAEEEGNSSAEEIPTEAGEEKTEENKAEEQEEKTTNTKRRRRRPAAKLAKTSEKVDHFEDSLEFPAPPPSSAPQAFSGLLSAFSFRRSAFDRHNEIRHRFGSAASGISRKRLESLKERSRLRLVFPLEAWPPVGKFPATLEMKKEENSGKKLFNFEPNDNGRKLFEVYSNLLSHHNPALVAQFAHSQPFFPPACLQMSEFFSLQQDHKEALEWAERAVLGFQCAFHTAFNDKNRENEEILCPLTAMRLSEGPEENRRFGQALALLAQLNIKQNCPGTAFALWRLLFSLSPSVDPHCLLYQADYFALRARDWKFLETLEKELDDFIEASEREEKSRQRLRPPVSLMPNILFGLAIARLELSEEIPDKFEGPLMTPRVPGDNSSQPLASSLSSSHPLQRALLMFPECPAALLKSSGQEELSQRADWVEILSGLEKIHDQALIRSPLAEKLVLVFTERSGALYKRDFLTLWLKREASAVLKRSPAEIRKFTELRRAFIGPQIPVPSALSQLQRSSYSDTLNQVPAEFLLAQRERELRPEREGGLGPIQAQAFNEAEFIRALAENRQQPLEIDGDENPLRLLLRSLLPWNTPVPVPAAEAAGEENFLDYQFSSDEEEEQKQERKQQTE